MKSFFQRTITDFLCGNKKISHMLVNRGDLEKLGKT